jgi:ABC-type multidrug transport system fused ATPase/permease subunit
LEGIAVEVIYQLTFFLALGLLAIVITVYVFAVSLLGRAMEDAVRSENEKLAERKKNNAKEMASIKKEIEEAEDSGQIPKGLIKKLKKLEKKDNKFDKELAKIRKAPKLLTVNGGVIPPGIPLLVAIIFSGIAGYFWYLYTIDIFIWIDPVFFWIVSLVAIIYSIFRIYCSLKVIESVAITSEEAALKKTVEAFKIAQEELEDERRPELSLKLKDKKFPLQAKANSEMPLRFELSLSKGDFAEDIDIHICLPPGFGFPNRDTYTLGIDHDYPDYIVTTWEIPKVIKGLAYPKAIDIKTPPTAGSYNIVFYKRCKGLAADPVEEEIIVE